MFCSLAVNEASGGKHEPSAEVPPEVGVSSHWLCLWAVVPDSPALGRADSLTFLQARGPRSPGWACGLHTVQTRFAEAPMKASRRKVRSLSIDQALERTFPGLPFLPIQHTAMFVDGAGFGLQGCRVEEIQKHGSLR